MIHYICRYCKVNVSPRATTCPHCGEPNPAAAETNSHSWIPRIVGLILLGLSIFYWGFDINIINSHPVYYAVAVIMGLGLLLRSKPQEEPHH